MFYFQTTEYVYLCVIQLVVRFVEHLCIRNNSGTEIVHLKTSAFHISYRQAV
jgi:hypothetical protein